MTAKVSQTLKTWIRDQPGWAKLYGVQQESLDMIFVKIGRILSGNPFEMDHWRDIAGYANLVNERLGSGHAAMPGQNEHLAPIEDEI